VGSLRLNDLQDAFLLRRQKKAIDVMRVACRHAEPAYTALLQVKGSRAHRTAATLSRLIGREEAPDGIPPMMLEVESLELIARVFDADWYLSNYPDVLDAGIDPLTHYLGTGWRESRNPNALFNADWYRQEYLDGAGELNPAVHYLATGWRQGNLPSPQFDAGESEVPRELVADEVTPLEWALFVVAEGSGALDPYLEVRGEEATEKIVRNSQLIAAAQRDCDRSLGVVLDTQWIPAPKTPLFSVLMPIYSPNMDVLHQAISSVRGQSLKDWELIIVDDGNTSPAVERFLRVLQQVDSRIRVVRLEDNQGIAAASDAGLEASNGDFIALLDQDDLLSLDALEQAKAHLREDTDVLYSDEALASIEGRVKAVTTKPDWSPCLLLGSMYLGHLGVYRRSLALSVGGFRSAYEYSQDFDFALRATTVARAVTHIPHILYFWREGPGSAAGGGGKAYARVTNIAATKARLSAAGVAGDVQALPHTNSIAWPSTSAVASIVVPTDSVDMARRCVSAVESSGAPELSEVLLVVSSATESEFTEKPWPTCVRIVVVDGPYNFSRKCNQGFLNSLGDVVVFLNDDVIVAGSQWLRDLLGPLEIPGVGAVSPQLVYEDGTIQYAGMYTAAPGFVGTAFHGYRPEGDSPLNLLQSMREVAIASGACLAMKRRTFEDVGGFDEVGTPISHSDVELSLRVRTSGLACIYTPRVSLVHTGHASLSAEDPTAKRRDHRNATRNLLTKYGETLLMDPYFPEALRSQVQVDFVHNFRIDLPVDTKDYFASQTWVAIVSNDLSLSGAPASVLMIANVLRDAGCSVVVFSPHEGPMKQPLLESGYVVITDESLGRADSVGRAWLDSFDLIIANTVQSLGALVDRLPETLGVAYLHEGSYLGSFLSGDAQARAALLGADSVWAASSRTAECALPWCDVVSVIPVCADPHFEEPLVYSQVEPGSRARPLIATIGSYEPRKGQDLAILAHQELRAMGVDASMECVGRVHDRGFFEAISELVEAKGNVRLLPQLGPDEYRRYLSSVDILLVASRDDPLPLVAVEALAVGRILVVPSNVGVADFVEDGVNGYVAESPQPADLAQALRRALDDLGNWENVSAAARGTYRDRLSAKSFSDAVLAACTGLQLWHQAQVEGAK
jgi:GT2 family glycosyltransferase